MSLTAAVWFVILCALVMANLPFLMERRLAPWPWGQGAADTALSALSRWGLALVFLAALALWCWATLDLVGGSFAGGGSATVLFLVKLLISLLAAGVLLALPGWRRAAASVPADDAGAGRANTAGRVTPAVKSFFDRFLELLIGYALVGTLGFALELNLGNAFPQGWEFYAVTLALFLVLGYPGFVWRYMMRRHPR